MKSAAEREKYRAQFDGIDFRAHPEKYRVGRGEEGVLSAEPYKSELLPHWRFKTPDVAEESARKIYQMFLDYLAAEDFVGADMARKFLQMGYTRSRRYANHRSGKNTTARFPKTFAEFPALTVARNCRNKLTKKKPNPPADFTLITNAPKKTDRKSVV